MVTIGYSLRSETWTINWKMHFSVHVPISCRSVLPSSFHGRPLYGHIVPGLPPPIKTGNYLPLSQRGVHPLTPRTRFSTGGVKSYYTYPESVQWRRNECGSGVHRSGAKVGNFYLVVPFHLFGSKSTISRFGECFRDSQYSLVSFFLAVLLLTVPPVPSHL